MMVSWPATQLPETLYENHHVPLICSLAPAPIAYQRNFMVRGDEFNTQEGGTIDFDVVTETGLPALALNPGGVPCLAESGGHLRQIGRYMVRVTLAGDVRQRLDVVAHQHQH